MIARHDQLIRTFMRLLMISRVGPDHRRAQMIVSIFRTGSGSPAELYEPRCEEEGVKAHTQIAPGLTSAAQNNRPELLARHCRT